MLMRTEIENCVILVLEQQLLQTPEKGMLSMVLVSFRAKLNLPDLNYLVNSKSGDISLQ